MFDEVLLPIARQFRPQVVLVSAGFDIARGDPLASMEVTPDGFAWMTRALKRLAAECCPGQLVFTLEGGYDLPALAGGLSAVLRALATDEPAGAERHGPPNQETAEVIEKARRTLRPFWSSLG